jgi:hypothetical protein
MSVFCIGPPSNVPVYTQNTSVPLVNHWQSSDSATGCGGAFGSIDDVPLICQRPTTSLSLLTSSLALAAMTPVGTTKPAAGRSEFQLS